MIYLIDDKKQRQELLFGWDFTKLNKYKTVLKTIYSYKQIKEESLSEEMFSADNFILFHESFFDNAENRDRIASIAVRESLTNWSRKNDLFLIKFSGAINTRSLEGNQASIPVNIIYRNLELFLKSCISQDEIKVRLKKLMFGENYKIEEVLLLKKEIWETKFKMSPLLNNKINEFNSLTNKSIDLKSNPNSTTLKAIINE